MSSNPYSPFFAEPPPPPPEERFEPDPLLGQRLAIVGPPVPPGTGVAPPEPVLGRSTPSHDALLWVVGVHGGSGATSVATVLGDGIVESPREWPDHPRFFPQVLLVARTHAAGLSAAENAVQEWAAMAAPPFMRLIGLLLVDDAPRIPRPLVPVLDRVLHASPHGWHLPWQEAWRVLPVDDRPLSFAARRTLGDIRRRALSANNKGGDNPLLDVPVHVEDRKSPRRRRRAPRT